MEQNIMVCQEMIVSVRNNAIALLCLVIIAGCGTIATYDSTKLYSGIRLDVDNLSRDIPPEIAFLKVITVIDLPFSFVADTTLLPYKAYLITTEDAQAQEQPAQEEGSITHSTTTTVLERP